ncbi:hypothetical protein KM043_007152 [Ampulex compressa]|nr:hypothetical protein KM043_007152 [Ampulex compressa]
MNLHYPTSNLKTPLTTAIDRGDPQIVALLLDKISTNLEDTLTQPFKRTILMYASYNVRRPEILQLLLKKGADIQKNDVRGWSSLHYAVAGEQLKNVILLLDNGAQIDVQDFEGRSPIMTSVYLSNFDIFMLLLQRGANVDVCDKIGFTALQLAILWRKREVAVVLIEKGCNMRVRTPLSNVSIGQLCKTAMPNIFRSIQEM